ncbi:methylenetetrahydrofolate reductase [Streptomyces viridosporus]|uniref:methylenetetrahydrofolate reductase n=1 Tax=Streptomyces viridosporus TaxID=67581 RepID=UPI00209674F1|nr:methylenetetrahydrofolate reductase [Streptomyces viridosporus]
MPQRCGLHHHPDVPLLFRADDYFRLCDRLASAGCHVPVTPAIMLAPRSDRIRRFARFGNATVPDDLARRPEAARNDPGQANRAGVAHATALARRLLDAEAPGLHYLTLNRPTTALEIHRSLPLPARADGASGTKASRGTAPLQHTGLTRGPGAGPGRRPVPPHHRGFSTPPELSTGPAVFRPPAVRSA